MKKGRWCVVGANALALASTALVTGCQTPIARGGDCQSQIEALRTEVRALEARQGLNLRRVPSPGIKEGLPSYESKLQRELEADIQKTGQDDALARDLRSRFARWLGDKAVARCGHTLCRLEATFEKRASYMDFSSQALMGCNAVWRGTYAITQAPGLTDSPRGSPLPFVIYLRKPEQLPPPGDATPCDPRESRASALLAVPGAAAPVAPAVAAPSTPSVRHTP